MLAPNQSDLVVQNRHLKTTSVWMTITTIFLKKVGGLFVHRRVRLISFDSGDDLSGSFCLIPTGAEPSPAVLKKENTSLRVQVSSLKSRLEDAEQLLNRRKEQDVHLRDSIFQATREVHADYYLIAGSQLTYCDRPNVLWVPQQCFQDLLHLSI